MINSIKKIGEMFRRSDSSTNAISMNDREFIMVKHQCPSCHTHLEEHSLRNFLFVCTHCNHHFRVSATERLSMIFDNGLYENISITPNYTNPIDFPGYDKKLSETQSKSGEDEAVSVTMGKILDNDIVVACMSFNFLGGSMGTIVGERIVQALFTAIRQKCPCLIITSSGGARMYEGLYSLMQMARTSHVVALYKQQKLPLFILLSDPTTGGVTASFAMLGDYIFAEPNALIGFAGPRVIEGTIKQKLPEGFQRAEFQLSKGFVDAIVERRKVREVISYFLYVHDKKQ